MQEVSQTRTPTEGSRAASSAAPPSSRRRFVLSLRALLILVLVLGAWLGWFVRNARIQHDAVAAVQRAGGSVAYDIDWRNEGFNPYARPWTPMRLLDGKLWGTKWLIDHLGIDKVSLLKLAQTCAACVKSLDDPRLTAFSAGDRQALKDRCADRGIAALSRAVELGLRSVPHLEDYRLAPLQGQAGFVPLVEKVKTASAQN
ncbi:MAG: hypothetical protein ACLQVF_11580 [Isosphaeraceae bacterium]